jgi:hypothetical protein
MNRKEPRHALLQPGMRCDIIIKSQSVEKADIRKAAVYDIGDNTIILSQTNPPLMPRLLGRNVDLTFLDKVTGRVVRRGFKARFVEILKDYKLYSDESVSAIVMVPPDTFEEDTIYDLRTLYRVKAIANCGIKIMWGDISVKLIDFSPCGLRFNHSKNQYLKAGQIMPIRIDINGNLHIVNVKIIRQIVPTHGRPNNVECSCVEFINPTKQLTHLLTLKSLEIERYQLSQGRL